MNFTVIEGGRAAKSATAGKVPPVQPSRESEAEQLRKALLALVVPEIGLTTVQALEEVCALLDDERVAEIERGAFLCRSLETIGIHFRLCNPEVGLSRPGFLMLVVPALLLKAHPHLSSLNPQEHLNLEFG